jgi:hypothetical protein
VGCDTHYPLVGFRAKLARALDVPLDEVAPWFDGDERVAAPDGLSEPAWLGPRRIFERLAAATLSPVQSRDLIRTVAKERYP